MHCWGVTLDLLHEDPPPWEAMSHIGEERSKRLEGGDNLVLEYEPRFLCISLGGRLENRDSLEKG